MRQRRQQALPAAAAVEHGVEGGVDPSLPRLGEQRSGWLAVERVQDERPRDMKSAAGKRPLAELRGGDGGVRALHVQESALSGRVDESDTG